MYILHVIINYLSIKGLRKLFHERVARGNFLRMRDHVPTIYGQQHNCQLPTNTSVPFNSIISCSFVYCIYSIMSSGGWEIVGRNKKDKSNGKINKLTKVEKKKFIENVPKVEDFRKCLYSALYKIVITFIC